MTVLGSITLIWQISLTGVLLVAWFKSRKRLKAEDGDDRITAVLNVLEERVGRLDAESQQYELRIQHQLQMLGRITERAGKILEKNLGLSDPNWVSTEEADLKALHESVRMDSAPPTLRNIEQTRERLKKQSNISLKAVLSEQLS